MLGIPVYRWLARQVNLQTGLRQKQVLEMPHNMSVNSRPPTARGYFHVS